MSVIHGESTGGNYGTESSINDRLRICEETILENERSIDKKLEEVKLELKDVKGCLERKESEIEGLLNQKIFMETELEDLRMDNEKLASDLMESVQKRSSTTKKLSTVILSDEVFLTPPAENDLSPQSNNKELDERMSALEQLMKTACKDMKQRIGENEAAIERMSFAPTEPTAIERISLVPTQPAAITHQHSNNDVNPTECLSMDVTVPPSDAEEIEKTECIMKEKLEKLKIKVEEDEQKIDLLLKNVNNHSEEVSFITERQHEMEDWDQSIQLHQKHCMESDFKGGLEEKIHVMQELQEKLRQSKEMAGMYKRVKNAEQFVNNNIAAIKEKVEENISGWNDVQLKMDECQGQIGDLKRNQQQLLDRDGTGKLIDQIAAAELFLNRELTRIKELVESDCVETQLIRQIEIKAMETDGTIQDNLDKIKERVDQDFGSLNALQEMLHMLLMRQDYIEQHDDVTKLVDRVDAVAVLLNNEISRVLSLLRVSDDDNPSMRECMRTPTLNERVSKIENIISRDLDDLKEKIGSVEEAMRDMDHRINRDLAPLREALQKESQCVASLVEEQNDIISREALIQNVVNTEFAKLRRDIEKVRERVGNDFADLTEKVDDGYKVYEEKLEKKYHEVSANLENSCRVVNEKVEKVREGFENDIVALRKVVENGHNDCMDKVEKEYAKLSERVENNCTMVNVSREVLEYQDQQCVILSTKIDNDYKELTAKVEKECDLIKMKADQDYKELTKKVENDCTIIKEETKKGCRELSVKLEKECNTIREKTHQDYQELKGSLEDNCNVMKEVANKENIASVKKIDNQGKYVEMIMEKMENDYRELTNNLESRFNFVNEKSDQVCDVLARRLENQESTNEKMAKDHQVLTERVDQERKEFTKRMEKESEDLKLFTKGLIDDFVNRTNSVAAHSKEDRPSHEEVLQMHVQLEALNEKLSLSQESTQHNLSAIGEKMGHMNGEVSSILEYQRVLDAQNIVERVKDTEGLLQDVLRKTKEELEKHEEELVAVKQWQTHVGEREEIARLPSKINGMEEKTRTDMKEQLDAAMSDIKKETEKIIVENSKGVKEKDFKDLKNEVKRLNDSATNNFTTLHELHRKCEEQTKAVKEWQKSVKEESERAELQNRISSAERTMSDNFTKLLEKINERPKDNHTER